MEKFSASCIVLVLFIVNVLAGPPYQTDDPEPPEPGHLEMFFAASVAGEADGMSGACPQVEFNYGAAENIQLSLSPQMAYVAWHNTPSSYAVNYGLGDFELGAKYRFLKETAICPKAAFYPKMVLPVGDRNRGLGSGYVKAFLPVWLQKSWGPWCAFGGGGYWFNPGEGNRNWIFTGAALQRDLGDVVTLGGEMFFHSAEQIGDENGFGGNLVLLWHLTKGDWLVFSAGRDQGKGNTRFAGYVAYRKTI
jgi:hypothetical protein